MDNVKQQNDRLFKKLTPANWLDVDRVSTYLVEISTEGPKSINGVRWATAILETELSEDVPLAIRRLFEVAQGVMCYGWFFYPLYTLGYEQMHRVIESAVTHRFRQLDGPKNISNYYGRMKWLQEQGVIPKADWGRWDASRRLRNSGSHSDRQSLVDQSGAVYQLEIARKMIESLFESKHE